MAKKDIAPAKWDGHRLANLAKLLPQLVELAKVGMTLFGPLFKGLGTKGVALPPVKKGDAKKAEAFAKKLADLNAKIAYYSATTQPGSGTPAAAPTDAEPEPTTAA